MDVETLDQAAMNMAIDEAILVEKAKGEIPPTVRFWKNRRAVVIGYAQKIEDEVNLNVCRDRGIQVVRRFSGGGAVYHDLGNLNYTVALEADHKLIKGLDIRESYRVLSSGVVEGLKELEMEAVFDPPSDLLVGDRKISGNAQSRRRGTVLHHGTLLVSADLDLLNEALNVPGKRAEARKVTSRKRPVANIADMVNCCVDVDRVKAVLRRGFERAFGVRLVPQGLIPDEERMAEELCAIKYSMRGWNFWRQGA